MPVKLKSKPAVSPKTTYKPLIVLGILVLLAVGSLAAWTIYQGQQVAADKARFAQAERDIDDLSKQVVASVGAPVKTDRTKECSKPNLELETTGPYCDIEYQLYFSTTGAEEANQQLDSLRHSLQEYGIESTTNQAFTSLESANEVGLTKQQYFDKKAKINCVIAYRLFNTSNPSYQAVSSLYIGQFGLNIGLSCGDYAKIEHYPMKS